MSDFDPKEIVDEIVPRLLEALTPDISTALRMETLKRKECLSESEVVELYGYNANTLRNWRSMGKGPAFVKTGKIILYRQTDLWAYLESRKVRTRDQN